jgi:type IX secretion system PorP/SprF family membrane protein
MIVLMGSIALVSKAQQSPQFSQFMFNNLVINPAYAGADGALSMTLLSRNQWSGVENAPTTQSFSAHTLAVKKQLGLGITVIRDQIGVHKNTNGLANIAYHLHVGKQSTFSLGLQGGITNLKSNYASIAGNSNDPKLDNSINETAFNIGAGIYFRTTRFHLGLSAPELLSRKVRLNDTLSVNMRRFNFLGYSRYRFSLSERMDMEPGVMIKFFPDLPLSYDLYMNFIYRKVLTLGASYRKSESVDMIVKVQLTTQLQFGYAYDYPISYAARFGSASHEFMIHYLFRNIHKNVVSPR